MFDCVSTFIDILIAFVGMVIAIIEIKNNKREQRKEDEREAEKSRQETIIREIALKTQNIVEPISVLTSFGEEFRKNKTDGQQIMQIMIDYVPEIVEKESNFIKDIENLYKKLLRNETEFSMSLGFERYINCFRDFLIIEKTVRITEKKYKKFIDYIRTHRDDPDPAPVQELILREHLEGLIKELDEIDKKNLYLLPFCKELQIKYGDDEAE